MPRVRLRTSPPRGMRSAVDGGVALATLMESAGRAAAAVLADALRAPAARRRARRRGPGQQRRRRLGAGAGAPPARGAGLGHGAARRAAPSCASAWRRCARAEGVREVAPDGPWPGVGLVVDALLGTGARGAPRPPMAALLERMLDLEVPVVAIDGPTGVDLQTGIVHGAPRAELSITFGGLRRGHLLARDEVGDVVVVDIGHPPADPAWPALVTDQHAAEWLRRLRSRDHKGARGRVVVVGGDAGMTGAAADGRRARPSARGRGWCTSWRRRRRWPRWCRRSPISRPSRTRFDQPPSEAAARPGAPRRCRRDRPRARARCIAPRARRGAGRARRRAVVLDADALVAFQGAVPELARAGRAAAGAHAASGRVPHAVSRARARPRARSVGRGGGGRRALPVPRCCSRACPR